jgi:hypothetical protein
MTQPADAPLIIGIPVTPAAARLPHPLIFLPLVSLTNEENLLRRFKQKPFLGHVPWGLRWGRLQKVSYRNHGHVVVELLPIDEEDEEEGERLRRGGGRLPLAAPTPLLLGFLQFPGLGRPGRPGRCCPLRPRGHTRTRPCPCGPLLSLPSGNVAQIGRESAGDRSDGDGCGCGCSTGTWLDKAPFAIVGDGIIVRLVILSGAVGGGVCRELLGLIKAPLPVLLGLLRCHAGIRRNEGSF